MTDKAVLCGINKYKSISPLKGCLNDLDDVRRLLIDNYNFTDANIRIHRDQEVQRPAIVAAFDWLASGASPGDRLVFHYSGHGSYTKSKSADKDIDELLCLYDMQWTNEESFLRDTDLGALTRKIPVGATLTVILDSCHSGTGTKAFTSNLRSAARSVTPKSPLVVVTDTAVRTAMRQPDVKAKQLAEGISGARAAALDLLRSEETPPVFARFVEPPLDIQQSIAGIAAPRVRSVGQTMRTTLNHQLLAAASDKQTAADAFIDGQYRGAFSFNLCATARLNAQKSYAEIMSVTKQRIKSQGFSQDPQIEGPFTDSVLFGGNEAGEAVPVMPVDEPSMPADEPDSTEALPCGCSHATTSKATSTESNEQNPLTTLNQLLRVSEKLIDLALSQAKVDGRSFATERSTSSELVVYVHGISEHLPGYSQAWHSSLAPHLSRDLRTGEVRWSQLVNSRSANASQSVGKPAITAQVEAEIEERRRHVQAMASARSDDSMRALATPSDISERSISLDDFSRYMLSATTREAVLAEFFRVVVPLLEAGAKLHVVSHSWGTVVAYEGLRRLDNRNLPGHVANLFTLGSALSIRAVQSNLFGRVTDGRSPKCVRRTINLDAGGDLVGGAIGDRFAVAREYLGLDPVGCTKIPFTNTAVSLFCAHRSYFLRANLAVNRDILARNIN